MLATYNKPSELNECCRVGLSIFCSGSVSEDFEPCVDMVSVTATGQWHCSSAAVRHYMQYIYIYIKFVWWYYNNILFVNSKFFISFDFPRSRMSQVVLIFLSSSDFRM